MVSSGAQEKYREYCVNALGYEQKIGVVSHCWAVG